VAFATAQLRAGFPGLDPSTRLSAPWPDAIQCLSTVTELGDLHRSQQTAALIEQESPSLLPRGSSASSLAQLLQIISPGLHHPA
jgi:hypothetical protein